MFEIVTEYNKEVFSNVIKYIINFLINIILKEQFY